MESFLFLSRGIEIDFGSKILRDGEFSFFSSLSRGIEIGFGSKILKDGEFSFFFFFFTRN